ncbi:MULTISPECIES: CaiB/BaiF CoA-transferase family protein [Micromonospora]|uniref:CaiB/BaiF CoA transferase family protein n=1 Tax=Micromonospora TaxID=1873 RepID=UPI0003EEA886|nr:MULTISPECIES: CoA transferase [Micromonospora]EWM64943.1 CAIB/BAIF family protein [Micromonospora sp. M42]MBQ1062616.1 CoA transferase [Micromonospora sp. C41]MCK1804737.1 CoA transferase [Micromonospora sp. R42106]MCK1830155.1 CoA transferase [Micromonospora sp. R42003]MCK1841788.1 CoA transferase [Micromonospora sp. R42004]
MSSDLHHEGPLHGVRVVEFGSLLAGPFCSQLLADFGAEVIKCEPPRQGDPMREWGREKPYGKSLWWPIVARNKKSITVDLRTPEGQSVAQRLIAQCDVVVENFRPGTMQRWGLGYEQMSETNPGLVMVQVSGFGQNGPYSARPGYGSVGEAMGGLRYVVGDPQTPPSRVGISLGDSLAGTFAALGALLALRVRDRTGRGQMVDSAIYEAVLAMMESLLPEYALAGHVRERTGAILPNIAPSNVYPTRDDGLVLIAANQDTVFRRLAAAMDMAELGTDERFATHSARGRHQVELDAIIATWSAQHDTEHLMATMVKHDVPVGRVYRAPEMLEDEHFAAREAIVRVAHPEFGEFPMQNVVPRLSATPGRIKWAGPRLGEHTDEVLTDIVGLESAEIDALRTSGVI